MNKIATIAGLTWKAAFRYRLFWILAALLLAAVVGLPLIIKDDGTAEGMVQILLTYTLTATAGLLGLATLWLSCGTLARDVEECQIQMLVVKPIARWQIWLGKWLGILALDAVLLALAGLSIFCTLKWRAAHLAPDQQKIVNEEIFVSRASAREATPNLEPIIDKIMAKEVKDPSALNGSDLLEKRKQIKERLIAMQTGVPAHGASLWGMDLRTVKDRLKDQKLQLRIKFHTASGNTEQQYPILWRVGPTNSTRQVEMDEKFPADSFQVFALPNNMIDDRGILWVEIGNPNDEDLTFPLEDGLELLYPESTFAINFARGLLIIFCWLAFLTSIGLAAASFLSFPVAAFVSLAMLMIGFSSGTVSSVVEQGTIVGYDASKGGYGHSVVDLVAVPIFQGVLKVLNLVQSFSPIDALSSGRSITWGQLGMAVLQIVGLLSGVLCALGIIFFTRRELASAQGNN